MTFTLRVDREHDGLPSKYLVLRDDMAAGVIFRDLKTTNWVFRSDYDLDAAELVEIAGLMNKLVIKPRPDQPPCDPARAVTDKIEFEMEKKLP